MQKARQRNQNQPTQAMTVKRDKQIAKVTDQKMLDHAKLLSKQYQLTTDG